MDADPAHDTASTSSPAAGAAVRPAASIEELDLAPPSAGKTVVIGCGNLLRGDDAFGPIVVRHLWDRGVPEHVLLVDGGTAGMDVAFKMDGARRVVIVDAAATGAAPGTVFKVPAEELEQLPPLAGLHSHQFRWDHALAFARWLLGERYPTQITVLLVEVASCEPGAELTAPVAGALDLVADLVVQQWQLDDPAEAPT